MRKPTRAEIIKAIEKLAYYDCELNLVRGEYTTYNFYQFKQFARLVNFIDGIKETKECTPKNYFGVLLNKKEAKRLRKHIKDTIK